MSQDDQFSSQQLKQSEVLKIRGNFVVLGSDTTRVSTVLGGFEDYQNAVNFKEKMAHAGWLNVAIYKKVNGT
jgi:hypothetical protein